MGEIETAVVVFHGELEQAGAPAASIDELVDHLREIVEARIAAGDDVATAIRTARQRLGDPKALARECARVRSSFAPKPSQRVAWLTAALVVAWFALWATLDPNMLAGRMAIVGAIVVAALVMRSAQAMAFVLGYAASTLVVSIAIASSVPLADLLAAIPFVLSVAVAAAIVIVVATSTKRTALSFAMVALAWTLGSVLQRSGTWDYRNLRVDVVAPAMLGVAVLLVSLRLRGAAIACVACGVMLLPDLRFALGRGEFGNTLGSADIIGIVHTLSGVVTPFVAAVLVRSSRQPNRPRQVPLEHTLAVGP